MDRSAASVALTMSTAGVIKKTAFPARVLDSEVPRAAVAQQMTRYATTRPKASRSFSRSQVSTIPCVTSIGNSNQ